MNVNGGSIAIGHPLGIGDGHIGVDAFRDLFAHPATAGVPFVLETPGSREPGNADIPLLKRLRAEAAAS